MANEDHPRRCTAKSKTSGQQCKSIATAPCGKCRFHGGATPRGAASPNFRHGQHSKYMPAHLKADYTRAVKDPELLSLRSQVALLASRELELTKQLSECDGPTWGAAVDRLGDIEAAIQSGDKPSLETAFAVLRTTVREGADKIAVYQDTWTDLRALAQEKAKLAQAEFKRMETLGAFVRTEDLVGVLLYILEAVRVNVADRNAVQRIQQAFDEVIDMRRKTSELTVVEENK